jgi:5-hydroxyisourate hydrolase-like protein (transthyretin family)
MKQLLCLVAIVAPLLVGGGVLTSALALGTSSISGQVVDAKTHHPVTGVRVDLYADTSSTNKKVLAATLSRKDGSFRLSGVDEGQYRVELTKMGYEVEVLSGLAVRSQERTIIGEPVALHAASEEYESKMACNTLIQPHQTASVYYVCSGR